MLSIIALVISILCFIASLELYRLKNLEQKRRILAEKLADALLDELLKEGEKNNERKSSKKNK